MPKDQVIDAPHPICPLCQRPIPPEARQSLHHLVPKLKGGKGGPVVLVHQICHNEIHATLTEAELARAFNTPDALRAHPRLAKFIAWMRKRPATFHSKTPKKLRKRK
ncbi:HNH endonuclease [Roseovarius sp. D0-M9]|uniref:HNH endonuclease n=1 Tax=Roseovarius sp. D0-M9 TaxID=3127117 RepID=UPI00300FC6EF